MPTRPGLYCHRHFISPRRRRAGTMGCRVSGGLSSFPCLSLCLSAPFLQKEGPLELSALGRVSQHSSPRGAQNTSSRRRSSLRTRFFRACFWKPSFPSLPPAPETSASGSNCHADLLHRSSHERAPGAGGWTNPESPRCCPVVGPCTSPASHVLLLHPAAPQHLTTPTHTHTQP